MYNFDVIVVGAGHAGIEAALASARIGLSTAIFTLNLDNIAAMSCNPSIGGPGKGHMVKEIDALGGEMAKNIDSCFVQIRELNTKKGPAVRALRAQADKKQYQLKMKETLENTDNLQVIQGLVIDLIVTAGKIEGIVTKEGLQYFAKAVILAPGTFMDGIMHIGSNRFKGGRMGEISSDELSTALKREGIEIGRFKTGTPPRIDARSVDYSELKTQPGEDGLSFTGIEILDRKQIPCYISHTNPEIHQNIINNLERAPLYNGSISSTGPRYCPSIEDKVVRFSEKSSHHIFLEPEGYNTNELYVNGISTSLPADLQYKIVNSIKGLENAKIMRFGYAIEYSYVVPTELKYTLETKKVEGLYLAGQIAGTTGYEEAAALGIVAGINAALKLLDKEPLILDRSSSYIGTLIDDLITKGTNEPYRIFTALSEYRLILRDDNADIRLSEIGYMVGLLTEDKYIKMKKKDEETKRTIEKLSKTYISERDDNVKNILIAKNEQPLKFSVSLKDILKRSNIDYTTLKQISSEVETFDKATEQHIEVEIKYEGYIKIQLDMIERHKKLEYRRIPENFNYNEMINITIEAREKLKKIRPINIGQAARISGISPSDVAVLIHYLENKNKNKRQQSLATDVK